MMIDDASSDVASLPPWLQDFVRQLTPPPAPSQSPKADTLRRAVSTDAELEDYLWATFGVRIPKVAVCPHHQAPWTAFCTAFFARAPVIVIKGSRGLAGKSWLMALLGTVEGTLLGADVTILGGSGAQSTRVHKAMAKFWSAPNAPRDLLLSEPGVRVTKFRGGNEIEALMASQASVRGPHPQRLILDEVDEMDLKIYEAAMGQTMAARGIEAQTTIGSTHQHPDGTMTAVLKLARERGWPCFEWCYKETMEPHGWLAPSEVARKRSEMTTTMWDVEVELGEPSAEGRAIATQAVERMFLLPLVEALESGGEFPYREFEPPQPRAHYATGADWARTRDFVEIVTLRDDVMPMRLVAYQRFRKKLSQYAIDQFTYQTTRYPGTACHDATSLGGKMMEDFIGDQDGEIEGVTMVGKVRQNLFTDYILGIEHEELVSPRIGVLYDQHKYATNDDLRPGGSGHPPDGFVAGAMAYKASLASQKSLDVLRGQPRTRPEAPANGNGNGNGHAPADELTGLSRAFGFVTRGNGNGHNGNGAPR